MSFSFHSPEIDPRVEERHDRLLVCRHENLQALVPRDFPYLLEKLTEMTQTLAKADWEVLDRLAHTVKGNSLWVGDTEMAEVAIELRGAAKTSDTAKAESCIARLREIAAGL